MMLVKKSIVSFIGMFLSIIGVLGVIISQFMVETFLCVIAAISGLFTLAIHYNE